MALPQIGIFEMTANEYRIAEGISNSYLKALADCPANAHVKKEQTPAMMFGSVAHSIILENDHSVYAIQPNVDGRTKEGKTILAEFTAQAEGKHIVTQKDIDTISGMKESILSHPFASVLLKQGASEVSAFWVEPMTGLQCKCRPDRVPSNGVGTLIDLKTTADASQEAFQRACLNLGYAQQAAFYLDGMGMATGNIYDSFAFIAVEKQEPFRAEVYTLSPDFIEYGRCEYQRLLRLEIKCREEGFYPSYQSKDPIELYLPSWARTVFV